MPYRNPSYIQKKIELIKKGLPIDIAEEELTDLEGVLRGARGFYIDIIQALEARGKKGEDVAEFIAEESKNIAYVELALRTIDDFRMKHRTKIRDH